MGLPLVDRLASLQAPELSDYVVAASEYVRLCRNLTPGQSKAAQIRLSAALGRAFRDDLEEADPRIQGLVVGERNVEGELRVAKADVSQIDPVHGVRLAVEIKPVNLAVGRAIWNRFGDIRAFSVNVHLKSPSAVIGGILAVPVWEMSDTTAGAVRKSTVHLISRLVERMGEIGGRRTAGDAAHLLEGVGVVIYDPDTAVLDPVIPPAGSGLRWDEAITALAATYAARFLR